MSHLQAEGADQSKIQEYIKKVRNNPNFSISKRRFLAAELTERPLFFSWNIPRTREGFYHYKAGILAATKRAIEFGPYADLLWLETGVPSVEVAAKFARGIRSECDAKQLVYNLSPSFNWMSQGFDEASLRSFIPDLAKHGYVCHFSSNFFFFFFSGLLNQLQLKNLP